MIRDTFAPKFGCLIPMAGELYEDAEDFPDADGADSDDD